MIQGKQSNGVIGGSDSFTIIGPSGIGKSSAIYNTIRVIGDNQPITFDKPYTKIISFLICQCPHDASVKGLLLEILRQVDIGIGSDYYSDCLRRSQSVDVLIGMVSQVTLNHVGLLVVDEIQNVCSRRNGINLVAMLTQLINCSGISICMVGTPEASDFFEGKMQLARRTLGLKYSVLSYDSWFREFCSTLYAYQYTQHPSGLTNAVIEWLYEHSAGLVSMVISLVHDAQEIAITNGKEILNLETLAEAYDERMKMMQGFIRDTVVKGKQISNVQTESKNFRITPMEVPKDAIDIYRLIMECRENKEAPLKRLRQYVSIEEVAI